MLTIDGVRLLKRELVGHVNDMRSMVAWTGLVNNELHQGLDSSGHNIGRLK